MKILNNWSVVYDDRNPYKAPEQRTAHLCGQVSGHERFEDNTIITTSSIKKFDGELVVTHSGSKYKLGDADEKYESAYPNAKERLLKSLSN